MYAASSGFGRNERFPISIKNWICYKNMHIYNKSHIMLRNSRSFHVTRYLDTLKHKLGQAQRERFERLETRLITRYIACTLCNRLAISKKTYISDAFCEPNRHIPRETLKVQMHSAAAQIVLSLSRISSGVDAISAPLKTRVRPSRRAFG